jgi:hypothetical protein
MERLDRPLDRLLAGLAGVLAASREDRIRVRLGDWPDATADCLDLLRDAGLLADADPERTVICDGCERGCMMEVEWSRNSSGNGHGFIICDKRDDIGRVPVEADRLRAWQFSMEQIASVLSMALGVAEAPRPVESGNAWRVGAVRVARSVVEAALCRRADDVVADCPLTVVLGPAGSESTGTSIGLAQLIRFKDHRPVLDRSALQAALAARFGDTRIACEIMYSNGQIVLVNRVTGETRKLARPDFDSANDNIFQTLFDNPDRKYSIDEMRRIADKRDLNDLHKVPETLHFKGHLKSLFFRVSKNTISFTRTATRGQLAVLGIDPRQI